MIPLEALKSGLLQTRPRLNVRIIFSKNHLVNFPYISFHFSSTVEAVCLTPTEKSASQLTDPVRRLFALQQTNYAFAAQSEIHVCFCLITALISLGGCDI